MIQTDYRSQLKSELDRRKMTNPRYSLRAFAAVLGVSAAYLSNLLQGKRNLSMETALRFAKALRYSESETAQFCRLIQLSSTRASKIKDAWVSASFESEEREPDFAPLDLEAFQALSDWYHYAILMLCECRGFRNDPTWMARKLGISREECTAAVQRLILLGLLKRSGPNLIKVNAFVATPTDRRSQALRNHHLQMIEKAKAALEGQSIDQRDVSGITLAISADQIPQAKEEIKRFRRRMARLLDSGKADRVYQLNVQFFGLTKPTTGESR